MTNLRNRASANHYFSFPEQDWLYELWDVIGTILIISIGIYNDIGAGLEGGFQSCHKGLGKALVAGQGHHMVYAAFLCYLYRMVDAAVVNDEPLYCIDPWD